MEYHIIVGKHDKVIETYKSAEKALARARQIADSYVQVAIAVADKDIVHTFRIEKAVI